MFPSFDQVQFAAYHRWEQRYYGHGQDREDWLAAEQDLLLRLNYKVLVHHSLADGEKRLLGNKTRPICRFCERTAPGASFRVDTLAIPETLGNRTLFTIEECDECRALFEEGIEAELSTDLNRISDACASGGWSRSRVSVSIEAFKGLTKLALSMMPRQDLATCEGAIEWVCNPDHDFDAALFGRPTGYLHLLAEPVWRPWAAVLKRSDADMLMPSLLFFLATRNVVAEVAIPLCGEDEDLDGLDVIIPRVSTPDFTGLRDVSTAYRSVPLTVRDARTAAMAR